MALSLHFDNFIITFKYERINTNQLVTIITASNIDYDITRVSYLSIHYNQYF